MEFFMPLYAEKGYTGKSDNEIEVRKALKTAFIG